MYRFIGVIKGMKNETPYELLLNHRDFSDKQEALEVLSVYRKIDIPRAIFKVIDKPVSLDEFFKENPEIMDKRMYSDASLLKLEMMLNMEIMENKIYKNIDLLLNDRKAILEIFDMVYEVEKERDELGKVLLDETYQNNIILGQPSLDESLNFKK